MTFLVDTNVAVYAQTSPTHRDACIEILEAVARGDADGRMSVAILEEIWHIELSGKVDAIDGLARRMYALFTPLLPVTDEIVASALEVTSAKLGANDRIHVATARANGIVAIVSADAGFDRLAGLRRIDPLDDVQRRHLLRG